MSRTKSHGLHVVVTGASSGIGAALVREYGAAGARVTLVARRRALMAEIARGVGGQTLVIAADLADLRAASDWLAEATAAFGPIDVLVNNAGAQIVATYWKTDLARAAKMLALDLGAPLRLTHAVLPAMLERRRGVIVDMASMAAIAPPPGMVFYNAAKAGLAAASESLRGELRGTGVNVVTVYPGPVKTAMSDAGYAALEDNFLARVAISGNAEGLARRVRRAAERGKARVIYPRCYALLRHFPNLARFLLDRYSPRPRDRD